MPTVHYTDVGIVNAALVKVGEAPITSLDENTSTAKKSKIIYTQDKDSLLRSHPWGFAKKRVMLALSTDKPAFGYQNKFILPDDCLRILDVYCGRMFNKEGNYILTDDTQVGLLYVWRVDDANLFDASFVEILTLSLLSSFAWAFKGSRTLREDYMNQFAAQLRLARGYSATEGSPGSILEYGGEGIVAQSARVGHKISRY